MADSLHMSIAGFRETILSAVAKLEFQLRDTSIPNSKYSVPASTIDTDDYDNCMRFEVAKLTRLVGQLSSRIASLEEKLESSNIRSEPDPIVKELMTIRPQVNSRNILVSSVRSTPALAAAVAAATSVPALDLGFTAGDDDEEEDDQSTIEHNAEMESVHEVKEEPDVKMEVVDLTNTQEDESEVEAEDEAEAEVEEEEEDDEASSGPDLKPIKIDGKPYYIDDEQNVYAETEDGYEQVGTFDAKTKKLIIEEEEDEEQDDIVVEDFVYKGKTYQKDEDNNVYLDGEQIGVWNGKRIVPVE